jgi:hypothetical protein
MRIKQQKQLWQLITDLGIAETSRLLTSFVEDDEFEMELEDDMSLLYLSFSGYINNGNHNSLQSAISGFIQFNLHKGDKLFKKNRGRIDTTDIEERCLEIYKKLNL